MIKFETVFDSYVKLEIIGEGGSGSVFKVENEKKEVFALKVLDKITSDKLKRFKNELNFHLNNKHKNIVTAIDSGFLEKSNKGEKSKYPFYVMSFYKSSLRELIDNGIPHDKILPWFFQIIDGVESAHASKIFHRDLKPENILFDPENNIFAVADFGIAHFNHDLLVTSVETGGKRLANFPYSAPEQKKKDGNIDNRTDIYALGLILNEMFTKQIPSGTNFQKVRDINPDYSFLDEIIDKMLSHSIRTRQESIEEVRIHIDLSLGKSAARKRINSLNKTKDDGLDLNDPIVSNPVKILKIDYRSGKMIFFLNHRLPDDWIKTLANVNFSNYLFPSGVPKVEFNWDKMVTDLKEGSDPQDTTDLMKYIIGEMNRIYASKKKDEFKIEKENKFREIKNKIKEEEKRIRILQNIKF